jgi:hypothetical protein
MQSKHMKAVHKTEKPIALALITLIIIIYRVVSSTYRILRLVDPRSTELDVPRKSTKP